MAYDGVNIQGTTQVMEVRLKEANSLLAQNADKLAMSSLYSHILKAYQENKDAKESAQVNSILIRSLRQYNGEYDPEDLADIIDEGGSDIYMNLTSTKVRAAIAWIKDILLAEKEDSVAIEPTPIPDLPEDYKKGIKEKVEAEFEALLNPPPPPQDPNADPQAQQQQAPDVQETIKEMQERKRDLYDAITEELNKEAKFAFKILEEEIKDSLKEGKWDKALSEFIDDFCIFPTAILKGPIICKKKKLSWENGQPVVAEKIVSMNKRISPFDVYPAPEADNPNDGNFLEVLRMSRAEVANLKGTPKYKDDAIKRVLEQGYDRGINTLMDTHTESDKAEQELKDNSYEANKNLFHGLHFFGTAPVKLLLEWGMEDDVLLMADEDDEVEIEAIVIGSEVVKCVLNDDPLGRRPYYIASFQKRPGSFWGSAPPWQMRDIQRMCNASSRALANNMGLASGPITELYVDRLADGTDVSELKPRDIVQVTSDPTGGSGRAVQFFSAPSHAQELLAVYQDFERRADDVTMIPRYSYGNERSGGAAQTASGLSMLLESASKGIKDAIRHIDEGVIVPRVETEFYIQMLQNEHEFSGDVNVIAKGSQALTLRGAEQMRRNEFLQVTANPIDQEIMGIHGRAQILRKMADDLGLGENIIPSRQELKASQKKKEEAAAQASQQNDSMAMVKMQTDAQLQQAQANNTIKMDELQAKREKDIADIQLRVRELEQRREETATKAQAALQSTQMTNEAKAQSDNKQVALSIQHGDKMNA